MSVRLNHGEPDAGGLLRSRDRPVAAVAPRRPAVPAGAPGALSLEAQKQDIMPEYPHLTPPSLGEPRHDRDNVSRDNSVTNSWRHSM